MLNTLLFLITLKRTSLKSYTKSWLQCSHVVHVSSDCLHYVVTKIYVTQRYTSHRYSSFVAHLFTKNSISPRILMSFRGEQDSTRSLTTNIHISQIMEFMVLLYLGNLVFTTKQRTTFLYELRFQCFTTCQIDKPRPWSCGFALYDNVC